MPRRIPPQRLVLGLTTLAALAVAGVLRSDVGGTEPETALEPMGTREAGHHAQLIQIALCLDTSGSMEGLIEAAKQKLWAMVNDLATAEPTPKLEVALITFGNDGHLAENGWVQIDAPLTTDLDRISQHLFSLTTNGGSEYVARALHRAEALAWDSSENALRLIVVAGNESADQDPLFTSPAICNQLESRNILVNSIYCGPAEDEISPSWRNVAALASGAFANIDQEDGLVVVETPFDKELATLSTRLNGTYIPIGSEGSSGAENQATQDANAASLGVAAEAARGCAKASKLYSCSWDLIDAVAAGEFDLEEADEAELPEEMRGMSRTERTSYVQAKGSEREELRVEIADLGRQRDTYIRDEIARTGIDETLSFDVALRTAIRSQAQAKGFVFPEPDTEDSASTDTWRTTAATNRSTASSSPTPAAASSQRSLMQQTRLAPSQTASPVLVRLDPARHGVEVIAIDALMERASAVRSGNSRDVREAGGAPSVPDLVVTLGGKDDWRLLTRLLGFPESQSSPSGEIWLQVGSHSYLFNDGC